MNSIAIVVYVTVLLSALEVQLRQRRSDSDPILKTSQSHWDFLILITRLILTKFLYNKKVEIYKTEFKQGKNNKIQ